MNWESLLTQTGPLGLIAVFVLMRLEKVLASVKDELVNVRLEVAKLSGRVDRVADATREGDGERERAA